MGTTKSVDKSDEVRTLLSVLAFAILTAIVLAFFMLHYYNPSGAYLAKNVLLDPYHTQAMRFIEQNEGNNRLVFDKTDFTFFDNATKQWKTVGVSMNKYTEFYTLVANESSAVNHLDEIQALFTHQHPATITLKTRTEKNSGEGPKNFLQVNFVENGDYYRIQLRTQDKNEGWAYFYHPGIYKEILKMFAD